MAAKKESSGCLWWCDSAGMVMISGALFFGGILGVGAIFDKCQRNRENKESLELWRIKQSLQKPEPPKATPKKLITDPIVEWKVCGSLNKLESWSRGEAELTKADLEKVTYLFLNSTEITDASLKEVAKLQNLTRLDLAYTKITDAGLKDIAKLQKLTWLSLTRTKITYAGVVELQKALPKCKIYGP